VSSPPPPPRLPEPPPLGPARPSPARARESTPRPWTGPAAGEGLHIDGVHVWSFTKVRGGVLVRTEETHTGKQVEANIPFATEILQQGLDAWLAGLKTAAEARSGGHRPC